MEKIGKLQKLVRGLEDIAIKCLDADDSDRARDVMTVRHPRRSSIPSLPSHTFKNASLIHPGSAGRRLTP